MKKTTYLMLFLSTLLLVTSPCWSQYNVAREGFEGGVISQGWSQEPSIATINWAVGSSGVAGVNSAFEGNNYLYLYSSLPQGEVKMVSPIIQVDDLENPELSFALAQPSGLGGEHDTLTVYVRSSLTASWQQLFVAAQSYETWQLIKVPLTDFIESGSQLQFAFEYKYGGGNGVAIDRFIVGDAFVCMAPYFIQVFRKTHNAAEIVWNDIDNLANYRVKISTTAMTDFSLIADVLDTVMINNSLILTGLQPNTTYFLYLKSDCDSGYVSDWTEPYTFKTLCNVLNVPHVENFDLYGIYDGDFPPCWNNITTLNGDWNSNIPSSYYNAMLDYSKFSNGVASLKMVSYYNLPNNYSPALTSSQLLSMPALNVEDITDYQVRFMAYTGNNSINNYMYVGLMSDATDAATFEEIARISFSLPQIWEEFIVSFANTQLHGKHVAFYITSNEGNNNNQIIYLDNVIIEEKDSCSKICISRIDSIGYDEVTLSWQGDSLATYRVILSKDNINPNNSTDHIKDTIVHTNSVHFNGLISGSRYYYSIQKQCSNNQVSQWSSSRFFNTSCHLIEHFPYKEDFERYLFDGYQGLPNYPPCWTKRESSILSTNFPAVIYDEYLANGSACLYFRSSANEFVQTILNELAVPVQEVKLTFMAWAPLSSDSLEVGVMTVNNRSSSFIPIDTIVATSVNNKEKIEIYFNKYQGVGRYIAFRSMTSRYNEYKIDDLELHYLGQCIPPYDIKAENILLNSCTLRWSQQNNETSYRVKIYTNSDDSPTSGVAFLDTVVNSTQLNLSGLTKDCAYYVYVASVCGNTQSDWHYYYFKTDCDYSVVLPYVEDFENFNINETLPCWIAVGYSFVPLVSYIPSTYYGNKKSKMLRFSNGPTLYASPVITTDIRNTQISFLLSQSGSNAGVFKVGVMSDISDESTFELVKRITMNNYNEQEFFQISLANINLSGPNKYIVFKHEIINNSESFCMDNLIIEEIPNCNRVSGLKVLTATESTARIEWEVNASALSYEVALCSVNKGPLDSRSLIIPASINSLDITALQQSASYDLYVRAICAVGDTSAWNYEAVPLYTSEAPAALPYLYNFEDSYENGLWILNNGDAVNRWYIGEAVNNGGNNGLYVSGNNGYGNVYSSNNSITRSHIYAYRTLYFEGGDVDISFDWKCNGHQENDYMAAFLVPASVMMPQGGVYSNDMILPSVSDLYSENVTPEWVLLGAKILNERTSWQHLHQRVSVKESGNYRLVFYWANLNKPTASNPPGAVDNIEVIPLSCSTPIFKTPITTDSSVVISWFSYNEPLKWEVKVAHKALSISELDTVSGLFYENLNQDTNVIYLNGLAPTKMYYAYVRSICDNNDTSMWAKYEVITDCISEIIKFPYKTDFEGIGSGVGVMEPCWTISDSQNSLAYVNPNINYTEGGNASLFFESIANAESSCIVASPYIGNINMSDLEISLYILSITTGRIIEVGIMSDLNDPLSFVVVDSIITYSRELWEKYTIYTTNYSGNGRHVAFRITDQSGFNRLYIDNIEIKLNLSCRTPENLTCVRISDNQAKISWSDVLGSYDYAMKISTRNIDPEYEEADVDEITGISNAFETIYGLDANTVYYFYVKGSCDSEDSYWSEPLKVRTLCEPVSLPYSQNFNLDNSDVYNVPPCWSSYLETFGSIPNIKNDKSFYPYIFNGVSSDGDNYSYRLYAYFYNVSSTKAIAILPRFDAPINELQLQFSHYSESSNALLMVGTMSDVKDASTFELLDTIQVRAWKKSILTFEDYEGENQYLAFMVDGDRQQTSYRVYIDNVEVDYISSCQPPTLITATNIKSDQAMVSWTPISSSDSIFNLQITKFNVGSDTELLDTVTSFVLDTMVSSPYCLVTGLQPQTTYYYYVRTLCDITYSNRFEEACSFTTSCSALDLPFFEGFENENYLSDCWKIECSQLAASTPNFWIHNVHANYVYEGDRSIELPSSRSTSKSNLVLPLFHFDSTESYTLKFMMYRTSLVRDNVGVKVWINSTPDTIGGTEILYAPRYIGTIPQVLQEGWYEFSTGLSVSDNYYIIFEGINSYGNSIYLDNISISGLHDCSRLGTATATLITSNSVTFTWPEDLNATFEYAIVEEGSLLNDAPKHIISDGSNSCTITGLSELTSYTFYLRNNCDSATPSAWSITNFITKQTSATIPYVHSFNDEEENNKWVLTGSGSNFFIIGQDNSYDGAKSLYITDDGLMNNYSTIATSYAYAYRSITFEAGVYELSYAWIGYGESNYDYGRLFLVPDDIEINMSNSSSVITMTNIPSGWINCKNNMCLSSQWSRETVQVSIENAGIYKLLVYWYNDNSEGQQPPLAIDSISINKVQCSNIMKVNAYVLSSSSVLISSFPTADSLRLILDTKVHDLNLLDIAVVLFDTLYVGNSVQVNNLSASQGYYFWIQGYCNGDTLPWVSGNFITDCAPYDIAANNGFFENFNSEPNKNYDRPDCWKFNSSYNPDNNPGKVNFYSSVLDSICFRFLLSGLGSYSYAATPEFVEPISSLRVRLKHLSDLPNRVLLIGTMSDYSNFETFQEIDRILLNNKVSQTSVLLSGYTGNEHRLVFAMSFLTSAGGYCMIDDVEIEVADGCLEPSEIIVSDILGNSARVSWTDNSNSYPAVKYRLLITPYLTTFADASVAFVDTIVTGNSVQLNNLQGNTAFKCYMSTICEAGDTSIWSSGVDFTTLCSVENIPYVEDFSLYPPVCWSTYRGELSLVFNGSAILFPYDGGWVESNGNFTSIDKSIKISYTSSQMYNWITSPEIYISQDACLTFDMALTAYNSNLPIQDPNTRLSDRFIVVISTDGGLTWQPSNTTVWSNTNEGDYAFNSISAFCDKAIIKLSAYQGMNIKIAFYGECSIPDLLISNDLHIDNVKVIPVNSFFVQDRVCEGYNYSSHGFNIPSGDLDAMNSPYTFERLATNANGNDSVITLLLTVVPNVVSVYNESICPDEVYVGHGFSESTTGTYVHHYVSSSGCDSTITLNLTVNPAYTVNDARTIMTSEMPYTYLDTVFNDLTMLGNSVHVIRHKTEAGCDSIVTLTLTVYNDVSLADVLNDVFEIYPNPIAQYEEVIINANLNELEIDGMVLEVFKSSGERVKVLHVQELPVRVDGFDASGLYVIRITTASNKVIYGKIVVK